MKKTLRIMLVLLFVLSICVLASCKFPATSVEKLTSTGGVMITGNYLKSDDVFVTEDINYQGDEEWEAIVDETVGNTIPDFVYVYDMYIERNGEEMREVDETEVSVPAVLFDYVEVHAAVINFNGEAEEVDVECEEGWYVFKVELLSPVIVWGYNTYNKYKLEVSVNGDFGIVTYIDYTGEEQNSTIYNSDFSLWIDANASVTLVAEPIKEDVIFWSWYNVTTDTETRWNAVYDFYMDRDYELIAFFDYTPAEVKVTASSREAGFFMFRDEPVPEINVLVRAGSLIEFEARPELGYEFVGWYDNITQKMLEDTNPIYSVRINRESINLTAMFEKLDGYMLTVLSSEGGQVQIEDYIGFYQKRFYTEATLVTMEAVAEEGYEFMGWFEADGSGFETFISGEATIELLIERDRDIEARFRKLPKQYTLIADVQPGDAGYIMVGEVIVNYAGGVKVDEGAEIELNAQTDGDYWFIGWFDTVSGELLFEDNVYTFVVEGDMNIVAKFKPSPYYLEVDFSYKGNGTVEYDGMEFVDNFARNVDRNATVTLKAIPLNENMALYGWYEYGTNELLSEDLTYTFTMDTNKHIYVLFDLAPIDVSFSVENKGTGFIVFNNEYYSDKYEGKWTPYNEYTIQAEADIGYEFYRWYDLNKQEYYYIGNSILNITMGDESINLQAQFREVPGYTLKVEATEGGYFSVDNYNDFTEKTREYREKRGEAFSVELIAYCEEGYNFTGWYENGELLKTSNKLEIMISKNVRLEARFEKATTTEYTLIANADPLNGGYITVDGQQVDYSNGVKLTKGARITLTAVTNDNYKFNGWYDNNSQTIISQDATYTFNIESDRNLTALFELQQEQQPTTVRFLLHVNGLGYIYNDGQQVDYSNGITVEKGTSLLLRVEPQERNKFMGWGKKNDDGVIEYFSKDKTYYFTLNQDTIVYAVFEDASTCTFNALVYNNVGGVIKENGEIADFGNGRTVEYGTQITLYAASNEGYRFAGWGVVSGGGHPQLMWGNITETFTVKEDMVIYAVFDENTMNFYAAVYNGEGGKLQENGQDYEEANGRRVSKGTIITLTAVPFDGYRFAGWAYYYDYDELVVFSWDTTYSFMVDFDMEVYAVFEKISDDQANGALERNDMISVDSVPVAILSGKDE